MNLDKEITYFKLKKLTNKHLPLTLNILYASSIIGKEDRQAVS